MKGLFIFTYLDLAPPCSALVSKTGTRDLWPGGGGGGFFGVGLVMHELSVGLGLSRDGTWGEGVREPLGGGGAGFIFSEFLRSGEDGELRSTGTPNVLPAEKPGFDSLF